MVVMALVHPGDRMLPLGGILTGTGGVVGVDIVNMAKEMRAGGIQVGGFVGLDF